MTNEQRESILLAECRSCNDIFTQARAMQALCEQYHYTQSSLAKKLRVSQSCVGNKIRLLKFSAAEQSLIIEKGLTERHARALLRIQPPKREKLIATAGNMRLTVQQTEELVEKYTEDAASNPPGEDSRQFSASGFLLQTQTAADKLRAIGYKTTCLTESGDGWCRITVTIVEQGFT